MKFGLIPVEDSQHYSESLRQFELRFSMDHLICRLHFPGMPPKMVTEAVELIGREVIPAYKKQVGDD